MKFGEIMLYLKDLISNTFSKTSTKKEISLVSTVEYSSKAVPYI